MRKNMLVTFPLVLTCVVTIVAVAAMGADRNANLDRVGGRDREVVAPDRNQVQIPVTEIIRYPDGDISIGRFDTRTGAIYRFRGNVRNPGVRNTWELRVPPVSESHSGVLEIQQIPAAKLREFVDPRPGAPVTFMVDIETGKTWILRLLPNNNGRWDLVPVHR